MARTLYVTHNNGLRDVLEYSDNAGKTKTGYDLTAASFTSLTLQIGTPGSFVIERDSVSHASEFVLGSDGIVTWTPGSGVVVADDKGEHACRWVLKTTGYPQGIVIIADDVEIVD